MAKRKKSVRKRSAKRSLKVKFTDKKFDFALRRLLFFGILFIISFVIYLSTGNAYVEEVFTFFSIIFGFLALAFLLVFLIFVFARFLKKK